MCLCAIPEAVIKQSLSELGRQLSLSHLRMFLSIWAKSTVPASCSDIRRNTNINTTPGSYNTELIRKMFTLLTPLRHTRQYTFHHRGQSTGASRTSLDKGLLKYLSLLGYQGKHLLSSKYNFFLKKAHWNSSNWISRNLKCLSLLLESVMCGY